MRDPARLSIDVPLIEWKYPCDNNDFQSVRLRAGSLLHGSATYSCYPTPLAMKKGAPQKGSRSHLCLYQRTIAGSVATLLSSILGMHIESTKHTVLCCTGVSARFLLDLHNLPLHGRHLRVDTRGEDPIGSDTKGKDPVGADTHGNGYISKSLAGSQPFASQVCCSVRADPVPAAV